MKTGIVANLIDWSKSFVDDNGSFYCGTTEEQKRNAAAIVEIADLVINTTDLHPVNAPEFNTNGGLYPSHNLVSPGRFDEEFEYTTSPQGKLKLGSKTVS